MSCLVDLKVTFSCVFCGYIFNTVYISIAYLVANETSDSSKSVTNVITDTFTTKLVKYKKFPGNEKQEQ